MTPAQVQAVNERLERKAVNERDDAANAGDAVERAKYRGRREGFSEAARILTEALAESEAAAAKEAFMCIVCLSKGPARESVVHGDRCPYREA